MVSCYLITVYLTSIDVVCLVQINRDSKKESNMYIIKHLSLAIIRIHMLLTQLSCTSLFAG